MKETWRKHEGKREEKGVLLISFRFGKGFWVVRCEKVFGILSY
jgi:hypothetical protein